MSGMSNQFSPVPTYARLFGVLIGFLVIVTFSCTVGIFAAIVPIVIGNIAEGLALGGTLGGLTLGGGLISIARGDISELGEDLGRNIARFVDATKTPGVASNAILRRAGGLLPSVRRKEHIEVWQAYLYDMREDGAPWRKTLIELLSILLVGIPRLMLTLRCGRTANL